MYKSTNLQSQFYLLEQIKMYYFPFCACILRLQEERVTITFESIFVSRFLLNAIRLESSNQEGSR